MRRNRRDKCFIVCLDVVEHEGKPRHNQILLIIGDAQGLCAPVLVMVEFINSIFDCFNVHARSNPLIKMGT